MYILYNLYAYFNIYLKSPAKLNILRHNAIANWHKVQSKIIFRFSCAPLCMRNVRALRIRHRVYAYHVGLAQSFVCPFMSIVVYRSSLIYSSFNHDWLPCIRLLQPRIDLNCYWSACSSLYLLHHLLMLLMLLLLLLIYLLFLFSLSSFSFLSALALSALLCHPIYGPLPLAMTHACSVPAPAPTIASLLSPILDPFPTYTFCVFDVFADISMQLSRRVSYRPC